MRVAGMRVVVCWLAVALGSLAVPVIAAAALPSVTVPVTTLPMSNSTASHTGLTGTVACAPGATLVGGGAFLRRVATEPSSTDASKNATPGLVLGGQGPSQGVAASKTPPPAGAKPFDLAATDGTLDPSHWFSDSNFTGAAEAGDQFATFGMCATSGGPAHTIVKVASTVGANATQVTSPPHLTTATCPAGDRLIGGGAITTTPDQFNDGVSSGNSGNLKPLGSYPSDASGLAATNGSTTATSWSAYGLAGIASATDKVTVLALCSTDPATPPVQVARNDVQIVGPQNGSLVDFAPATCPSATRLIGGGYNVDEQTATGSGFEPQQGWHMVGSFPTTDPTGLTEVADGAANPATWSAALHSGGVGINAGQWMNIHAFAMCAENLPALATTASAPVAVGGQVSDSATVSGAIAPTGTITFKVFGPGDAACATPLGSSTTTVTDNGTYGSAPFTAAAAGTYQWVASYGGDSSNAPVTGSCGATGESVTVAKASPTVSGTASPGVAVGGHLSDSAVLSSGYGESGSVTFSLYGPGDASCSQPPVAVSVASVSGDGQYSSSTFTPTRPGTYQWVAIYSGDANNNGAGGLCGAGGQSVIVTAAGSASLSVAPATVAGGGTVTASFAGVALPTAQDWVGVFAVGAPNTNYVSWFWTSSCTQALGGSGVSSGACPVVMPASGGSYELRLFSNNSFTVLATSNTVTDSGAPPATLAAAPSTVAPGGTTAVSWSGVVTPSARDWVGVYPTGAANAGYVAFFYASSCTQTPAAAAASGSCSFSMPSTPGGYEFRLFSNDSFNLLATSNTVTVSSPPAASLSASPGSVAGGAPVSVAWANVSSPTSTDWVAVYAAGAPAGQYVDWFYDSTCTQTPGAAQGSGSCAYSMPTTPGSYDFVLMAHDGNTVLATSGVVTVTGSAVTLTAAPSSAAPGDPITVSWSGVAASTGSDWIGLYATGGSDSGYQGFLYDATCTPNAGPTGVSSGSCTFTAPATGGTYEYRLFAHDGFTRLATSNQVTISG